MATYVYARWSGHVSPTVQLVEGEAWDADDPFVASHPDCFAPDPPVVRRTTSTSFTADSADLAAPRQPVEAATAEPGEKRRTRV